MRRAAILKIFGNKAIKMALNIDLVPRNFEGDFNDCNILPITVGHIHRTYKVLIGGIPLYLLQQINENVFKNIEGLMQNTALVIQTLAESMANHEDGLIVPELIKTKTNNTYHRDEEGKCWRMFTYVAGARTIETVKKYSDAFEGGKAYGMFLYGVSSLKPEQLFITIPDFHSLEIRYKAFLNALELNLSNRKSEARAEIEFAISQIDDMMRIPKLINSGKIPQRIVHNDTKFNNLIFSKSGKAIAVTDLDTVMPGSSLFDFGDAIRTAANSAREDETNLSNVKFDISIFEAYAAGYIEAAENILTEDEIDNFPEASLYMTYIIGIRFLTDFLNGDVYFQTRYPSHNLVRAKVQFELIRKMQQQLQAMQKAIGRIKARLSALKS